MLKLNDRQFHKVEGNYKCSDSPPWDPIRVWFQRSFTNSGTIYLFDGRPSQPIKSNYADHAFGWISQSKAPHIWLPKRQGWCNFWPQMSQEGEALTALEDGANNDGYIEFTDDVAFNDEDLDNGDDNLGNTNEDVLRTLAERTDFKVQNQHWLTPTVTALAVSAQPKEEAMADFDPYAAKAAQQARLSGAKQGNVVSNLKSTCTSMATTAVDNNKSAAVSAAYLTAGKIANDQVTKLANGHLPVFVRGYAATPLGKLVTANIAQLLIQHFKPKSEGANKLADAMVTQAYTELLATAGIEEFVDSLLNDPKIAKALKTVEAAD